MHSHLECAIVPFSYESLYASSDEESALTTFVPTRFGRGEILANFREVVFSKRNIIIAFRSRYDIVAVW